MVSNDQTTVLALKMKLMEFKWQHPELCFALAALFSINVSEAAVERSFSIQKMTHSKTRNKLKPQSVQDEMTIRFNQGELLVKVAKTTDDPLELSLVSIEEDGIEIERFLPNVMEEIAALPSFDPIAQNEHHDIIPTTTEQLPIQ